MEWKEKKRAAGNSLYFARHERFLFTFNFFIQFFCFIFIMSYAMLAELCKLSFSLILLLLK